jgi:FeS assembly SUF system protein
MCDMSKSDTDAVAAATAVEALKARLVAALRTVHDPEIPLNIYDLGLIYALEVYEAGRVRVLMTLTTPGCPAAQQLPAEVRRVLEAVAGVRSAEVEIVWEPQWTPSRMSEASRLQLGML